MSDLMDQYDSIESTNPFYEGTSSGALNPFLEPANPIHDEPISSGYVTVTSEEELPIFQRKKFRFKPSTNIIDVVVSNNIMVVALEGNHIQRIDINHPSEIDTIDVAKRSESSIEKIFMDPTGRHLIVSMKSNEAFYLGRNNKKLRALHKLKNYKVECVAWNNSNMTELSTGEILVGTHTGHIFETEIDAEENFITSLVQERPLKPISNLNVGNMGEAEPVIGLHVEKCQQFDKRYVVLAATYSRFYQFVGDIGNESPIFQPVLNVYDPYPAQFQELHSTLRYSCFSLLFSKQRDPPKYFAWLTGSGIYFGGLDYSRTEIQSKINVGSRLLPSTEDQSESPKSIAITDFHCILLYENRLQTICILNDEEDYVETIPSRFGSMVGLRSDPIKKNLWAFSESTIFQYNIHQESRDAWKLYLDKKEFELAKDYCKHNPAQMDLVLRKQAEDLFDKKQFQQAASYFALTQISFEEVALKFLQVKDTEALKMFLLKKMVNLKPNDKTQLTMLVTWLLELYLNELGRLRDEGKQEADYDILQEEFRKFINQSRIKTCLEHNKQVAYDLLSSHGDTENLIFFSMLMQDYPRVIRHHIQQDDYTAALEVLKKQKEDYRYLFEQFSPSLILQIPKQLIDLWKQRDLDAKKLIPALVTQTQHNNKDSIKYAIAYLEHCINNLKNQDQAIHNYLISLYCKMDEERPLLTYLNRQGEDGDSVCYDLKYALRLCSENQKNQSAVQIYSAMGLYEEAVDLALIVDIDQAKIYADKPEYDDVFKKKLWLKIARHVVEQKQDIGKAMELLRECSLLKIEDILPFFQDFVTIDHFKDAICDSLQEYNKHIEELKAAMKEATESAEVVRAEIHDIRNRYGTINALEKCAICAYPLVTRSFYYFPCTHVFHSDCLIEQVKDFMKDRQRSKVEDLQAKLASVTQATGNKAQTQAIKEELDNLVATECLYCGDAMIRSLDEPFIPPKDFEKMLESWK